MGKFATQKRKKRQFCGNRHAKRSRIEYEGEGEPVMQENNEESEVSLSADEGIVSNVKVVLLNSTSLTKTANGCICLGFQNEKQKMYGMRMIGKGHAGASKVCSVMNMPPPPPRPKSFKKSSRVIAKHAKTVAKKSMKAAAKEDTSVLSPAVPLLITLYLIYYNYAYSNSNAFVRAPCLFDFAFGIVLAKVSIVLLVVCMSKSAIPMVDIVMLCPFFQAVNIHFNSPMSEYGLLWVCLIVSSFILIQYCYAVITEICNHLGISCFKITPKQIKEESSTKEGKAS
ncbi:cholinephosphotransferase 1-like [Paramuricea clavata]|uniref:Cholinephosphotransferase 1-like n=1 Tax=Paramuricea clavata TaxID=317549 RepID=A0A7D9L500_PARCT|nr:cholinephosphotransferase 1-like [Paramuricea clavata]